MDAVIAAALMCGIMLRQLIFPTLEQSSRLVEFNLETDETGIWPFEQTEYSDRAMEICTCRWTNGNLRNHTPMKLSGDDNFLGRYGQDKA